MATNPASLSSALTGMVHVSPIEVLPVKPFLKWVGGKTQLLPQLDQRLPEELKRGTLDTYIEPFVGGGALFFHVAQKYPIRRFVLSDKNADLILAYWTIRDRVGQLITQLHDMQTRYLRKNEASRKQYYYQVRKLFNASKKNLDLSTFSSDWVEHTAQLIFLNKTCFNGLFRVNANDHFNVAFGKYETPRICDPDNLVKVAQLLGNAQIFLCDFEQLTDFATCESFVYIDPPYRPLTHTANFTAYSPDSFTELDQHRLAAFCRKLNARGAKVLMSNSDPANSYDQDQFPQVLYEGFRIEKTTANRMVNCRADKRGKITELLMMNYGDEQF